MRTDEQLVSVVVTTFNRIDVLKRALESVAMQTHRALEVIVMDDGSTDGTLEFLRDLKPGFPFRFATFPGRERSFLRNEGVTRTSGSLIAFLDDDDEWLPRKLERQVALAEAQPAAAMIYCFSTVIDDHGVPVDELTRSHAARYQRQLRAGHTFRVLARDCLFFTSSILVRRDAFDTLGGFAEDLVGAEDWDFYLRLSRRFVIAAVAEPLIRYRLHDTNSAMEAGLGAMRVGEARARAAKRMLEHARAAVPRDVVTESLMLRAIAMNHYWTGRNDQAVRFALAAFRASPSVFLSTGNAGWTGRALLKQLAQVTS